MGKRDRYRDHIDPEYQRWGRTYRSFPGVEECARLVLERKACGAWADIIVYELAEHARDDSAELFESFREHVDDGFAIYILMALETAAIPDSVDFMAEVLGSGDFQFTPYARGALERINTRDSRRALFKATHGE